MITSVIVTYNGEKWIERCLASLINSKIKNHDIIVIDNGSTDNTIKIINDKFSNIRVIETKENLGFGKANNIGLKIALKNEVDYVFLLNQDAWVLDKAIQKLINIYDKNPNYGIISPIHLNGAGKLDSNFEKYITSECENSLVTDLLLKDQSKEIYDVNFINAAAWLIPKSTLKKIGGFMPAFHHYGEDDNYIERCKYHSLKIGLVPNSFIVHDRPQVQRDFGDLSFKQYTNYVYSHILNEITNPNIRCIVKLKNSTLHFLKGLSRKPIATINAVIKLMLKMELIINQYKNSKIISSNFLNSNNESNN